MSETAGGQERMPVLYGVVRFAPGGARQVLDTVIMFASASAADSYAVEQGWPDYEVAPVRFFVHERRSALDALPPPARPSPAAPPSGPRPGGRPRTGGPALTKQGHLRLPGEPPDDEPDPGGAGAGAGTGGTSDDRGAIAPDLGAREAGSPGGPAGPGTGPFGPVPTASGSAPGPSGARGDPWGPVAMVPWGLDRWAVAVAVGADAADVFRAFGRLPTGLVFTAAYGDVDVVLVHTLAPGTPPRSRSLTVAESILEVGSGRAGEARWMTAGERDAYRAGHAEALDAIRRTFV